MNSRKIRIPYKYVAIAAIAIMVIPQIIFYIGWLRWYIALPASAILLLGTAFAIKSDHLNDKDCIQMPLSVLTGAAVVFILWIFLSGSCYTSVGRCDIQWRSATLRDLVTYDWPVCYPENNGRMSYYIMFWIVPALIGKLAGSFAAAFVALGVCLFIILMTAFLLTCGLFKDNKPQVMILIIAFMVLWSGLAWLGSMMMNYPTAMAYNTLEFDDHTYFRFFFRNNDDFLGQSYNQLPIWLVVPLMLKYRSIHSYAFLGLILFPFSPWGTAGLALLMLVDAGAFIIRTRSPLKFLKEALSVQNICAILSPFIISAFFMFPGSTSLSDSLIGIVIPDDRTREEMLKIIAASLVFYICEFGIYYLMTWKTFRHDRLYVSILPMLVIMPLIWISRPKSNDFGCDATLPQIYVLMIYMIEYVRRSLPGIMSLKNVSDKDIFKKENLPVLKSTVCSLIILSSFGTTVNRFISAGTEMITEGKISVQEKQVTTFADMLGYEGPFTTMSLTGLQNSVFYKYLAKPSVPDESLRLPISEELSEIRTKDDIYSFLDYLKGKDCTVFVSLMEGQGEYIDAGIKKRLKALGFGDETERLDSAWSFMGIADKGTAVYDNIDERLNIEFSDEQLKEKYDIDNWSWRYLVWDEDTPLPEFEMGERKYSAVHPGIHFVVLDNSVGRVIDAVSFDTSHEDLTCNRKEQ